MKNALFTLVFFASIFSSAGSVFVSTDKGDCKNGWSSMDVRVHVDNESFNFSPSCDRTFNLKFKTKSGVSCEMKSSMCSSYSSQSRLEVRCNNGASDIDSIDCKKPAPKTERRH